MNVLVADDEANIRLLVGDILREAGHEVLCAQDGLSAQIELRQARVDLVIADIRMPHLDGLALLDWMKAVTHPASVLILTAYGCVRTAVDSLKAGADDYLAKPFSEEDLLHSVSRIERIRKLENEVRAYRERSSTLSGISALLGVSEAMNRVKDAIFKVANLDVTVLLTGESGTGKELAASALHHHSSRAMKPLIAINCGAVPETLMESELFGHERGAFTGAAVMRQGRFEHADGGTIFLDEVGEMAPSMQVKFLRVMQDGVYQRVGSSHNRAADVRVIAATNRCLEDEIKAGRFREDLFYRLKVVEITLPALRDRPEDIPVLAREFLLRAAIRFGRAVPDLSLKALRQLTEYSWPGNVRELKHAIERAVALNPGQQTVEPEHFSFGAKMVNVQNVPEAVKPPETLARQVESFEKKAILAALERREWNQSRTAVDLGIARESLIYRMKKYGLVRPRLRE